MQSVSARWAKALREGDAAARAISKVDVFSPLGELLASTERGVGSFQPLQIEAGEITVDATADILRRCNLTFVDKFAQLMPSTANSLLSNVSGNEIKVHAGLLYVDGTSELLAQGVFGFAEDDSEDQGSGPTVSVSLFDRARRIRRAKFTKPYVVAKGVIYTTAIQSLLTSRWAQIPLSITSTSFTTPYGVFDEGDDPWTRAQEMAKAIGFELFFDPNGICVLRPRPTASSVSTFDYVEGEDASVLEASRRSSNENTFNGVIMVGGTTSNVSPPRAEAWDTNPSSPTYSGFDPATGLFASSAYGAVPYFETNSLLTTKTQCTAAAEAKLLELKGRTEQIEFNAFVNAAHEQRDVVAVKRAALGVDALYELESFNIPLDPVGVMSARTKQRSVS